MTEEWDIVWFLRCKDDGGQADAEQPTLAGPFWLMFVLNCIVKVGLGCQLGTPGEVV